MKRGATSALLPLVMIWLAVHAVLLAMILGVKFLTAKTMVLMVLLAGAVLFLFGLRRPARLTHVS
jgi:hypothetical protein